jgi:hypothetical protein
MYLQCWVWNLDVPVYVFTVICRVWNLNVPVYLFTVICQVRNLDVPVYVFTMLGLESGCPCLCIYNAIVGTWMSLFMYLQ